MYIQDPILLSGSIRKPTRLIVSVTRTRSVSGGLFVAGPPVPIDAVRHLMWSAARDPPRADQVPSRHRSVSTCWNGASTWCAASPTVTKDPTLAQRYHYKRRTVSISPEFPAFSVISIFSVFFRIFDIFEWGYIRPTKKVVSVWKLSNIDKILFFDTF